MAKVVSVDNGRAFNKSFCNGKSKVFQSAMAPIEGQFNLTVRDLPDDIWIEHHGKEWLIGDLAIRQKKDAAIQDRNPDKTNQQNIVQTLTACSLHANREDIVLLCNVPARDYSDQKERVEKGFIGEYRITHKAGDMAGKEICFKIKECHVLPEAECAYYGAVYDLNLKVAREDILNAATLVVDIGDQTTNYVSMNPGAEVYDDGSGSLDLGMYTAYGAVQAWLMQNKVEISQAQLIRHIIFEGNAPIYCGSTKVDYFTELLKQYSELERKIYNQLNALLKLRRYRFMIICGGGPVALRPFLNKRYDFMELVSPHAGQLLNCLGADIIYRLSQA
jgi:hypothetical protein